MDSSIPKMHELTIPTGKTVVGIPLDVFIERNCSLLPDGCERWDAPVMREPLLPLQRFDRSELRRLPDDLDWRDADLALGFLVKKHCAGMNPEIRPDTPEVRRAFHDGAFSPRVHAALKWAFSGMPVWEFPGLVGRSGLTVYEWARCFWTVFDGDIPAFAPWLNQWALDPGKPLPDRHCEYMRYPITRSWIEAGRPLVWPLPGSEPPMP